MPGINFGGVGIYPGAAQVVGSSTLPASPTFRQIYITPDGFYVCLADGTWTLGGGGDTTTAFQNVASLPGTAINGAAYHRTSDDTFWGVGPADTFNQLWSANVTASLAAGGTGSSLSDPNADRILFWDDSAGRVTWLTAGTGLTITGTTITSSGGAAINATNGVLPYRSDATTFLDSPLSVSTGRLVSTATATASGVVPYLRVITPADTAQTLDTEFTGMFFGGDASGATVTRQTADGTTIAIQREARFIGPTYTAAGATVITDAFTAGMTPPVASTNMTFTRGHTLGILDATSATSSITGGLVVAATFGTTASSVGIGGGNINAGGVVSASSFAASSTSSGFQSASAGFFFWQSRSALGSSANGLIEITNTAGTSFTRLNFGGSTNSFAGVGFDTVNGLTFQSAAGTATWNDATTAGSGTVANRYMFGIAAPTLTATNSSVTDTVASTIYIGGAPTASTNTTIGTAYALNVAAGNVIIGSLAGTGSRAVLADANGVLSAPVSDSRLKTNISSLVNPVERVVKLRGVSYDFILTKGIALTHDKRSQVGLIADEVEKVIPEAVGFNAPVDGVAYRYLNYEALIPFLVEAIKAQQIQINQLQVLHSS